MFNVKPLEWFLIRPGCEYAHLTLVLAGEGHRQQGPCKIRGGEAGQSTDHQHLFIIGAAGEKKIHIYIYISSGF